MGEIKRPVTNPVFFTLLEQFKFEVRPKAESVKVFYPKY